MRFPESRNPFVQSSVIHEFLTHPPLKELRVIFKEDEGPLNDSNDVKVVFVVSW